MKKQTSKQTNIFIFILYSATITMNKEREEDLLDKRFAKIYIKVIDNNKVRAATTATRIVKAVRIFEFIFFTKDDGKANYIFFMEWK